MQRFGTCNEAPTHIIGSKLIIIMKKNLFYFNLFVYYYIKEYLILNNVKDAIELILKPRESGIIFDYIRTTTKAEKLIVFNYKVLKKKKLK